jgi:hypothetical protein
VGSKKKRAEEIEGGESDKQQKEMSQTKSSITTDYIANSEVGWCR